MKKIFVFLFTLFFILCSSVYASTNTINSIDMKIYINENGDANVTETWTCNVNDGTESYHPYYNLGNSRIQNITVSDEDGITYETLNSWNVNSTFENKKYKCGIHNISDGVELCWGISEYGSKVYTVNYDITNFVSNLTDSQMVYWTLIPYDFSTAIKKAEIEIYSDSKFEDTLDVWGYGNYGGLCYVSDGTIKMASDGTLDTDEYMTILVKFPQNTFKATNNLNKDFEYYFNMAEDGSTKYDSTEYAKTDNDIATLLTVSVVIIAALWNSFIAFMVVLLIRRTIKQNNITGDQKRLIKGAEYYRDIPCNSNIFLAYYIAKTYGIIHDKTNIVGAIFLKWLKEKRVTVEKKAPTFLKKKGEDTIVLKTKTYDRTICSNEMTEKEIDYEERLYKMVYKASKDGILEKKELEKWCSSNYNNVYRLLDDIYEGIEADMINAGHVTKEKGKKLLEGTKYIYDEKMLEEAIHISGLKKYLNDYTLIHDREAIEVELFENYLIFAQMLGIASEVIREFKDLYPDVIEQSNFSTYNSIMFINTCSNSGMRHAASARSAAQSYSSGGGGFSSGGGGGGSFGGGGGRRRLPLIKSFI